MKIYIKVKEAVTHYNRMNPGKKMTLIGLGKQVFKYDKRIVAETTMEQYLSGWNTGNFGSKQPTVTHIAIIANVTGYPICDLIHVED